MSGPQVDSDDQSVQAAKAALRRRLLTARAGLPAAARDEASAAICRRLRRLPELAGVHSVLGYAAFGDEASIDDFLATLLAAGVRVHLPWVVEGRVGIAPVADLADDLAPGWRGVREPRDPLRRAVRPSVVDAVIAPGVGFDRRGGRLGHGGGHFDRLLARARRGAPIIGVGFQAQVVDAVPRQPHDQRVQVLVTEAGVLRV